MRLDFVAQSSLVLYLSTGYSVLRLLLFLPRLLALVIQDYRVLSISFSSPRASHSREIAVAGGGMDSIQFEVAERTCSAQRALWQ